MTYESSIALRYLRSKRKERFISFTTWAAAIGIAIGVMALIVVIAVMTGFQDEIRDRILGVNPHMLISDLSGEIVNPGQVVATVKNTEGVAAAFPFITFQGLAESGRRVSGVVVKGVDPKDLTFLSHLVKQGSIDALRERGSILVAKEVARELGVKTGDVFTILVPFGGISPMGATPETVRVRVGGIFQTGMYDIDNMLMVMSLADVQALLGAGVSGIEVKLKDVYAADKVRTAVAQKLGHALHRAHVDGDEQEPLFSAQAGEDCHVHHSRPHHFRGELQYHKLTRHDRHGKEEGHRDPQGYGRQEPKHHEDLHG